MPESGAATASRMPRSAFVPVLLALLLLVGACFESSPTPTAEPAPDPTADSAVVDEMPAWDGLDQRWGTYVSEREWGNPRESQYSNGWGMTVLEATKQDYRFAEDGIAALSDDHGEFHVGWAFWDGAAPLVMERLFGLAHPQGDHGETIIDRRTFGAATLTSSYADYRLTLPRPGLDIQRPGAVQNPPPTWDIRLESARVDDTGSVMRASVTNTGTEADQLHVLLKGWFGAVVPGTVTAADDSLTLQGSMSTVAVAAEPATGFQASDQKRALDANLRGGGLSGSTSGTIGALDYVLDVPAGETRTLTFGVAEAPGADETDPAERASQLRASAGLVLDARAAEAATLFRDDVTAHQDLYAAALSSLLWARSYYAWDGSGLDDAWAGTVDVHDVLVMPDKWEYPWVASWDTAFHAVAASLIDPDLAAAQLRFLFSDRWQQPDGHVPCAEWVMAEECPPLFAWSALKVAAAYDAAGRTTDGDAFLDELFPGLLRQYAYWQRAIAVGGDLYGGGFLGMDNLPRATNPDGATPEAQVDGSAWMAAFARDLAEIADRLDAPTQAALLRDDHDRVAAAVNDRLWDEETGFYYDAAGDGLLLEMSYAGLVPLIAGIVPAKRLDWVLEAVRDPDRLLADGGVRSLSARSSAYTPGYAGPGANSNWRGPVWLPYTYLVIDALRDVDPALAADLSDRAVTMVEDSWEATGRLYEYFDGARGTGLGADAQTGWTAVVANLIAEAYPAP